jgi:AAA domain
MNWDAPGWKEAAEEYHATRPTGDRTEHVRYDANGHGVSPLTVMPWWRDPETIPRRQFLYDRHYIRGTVGATIAAGGRAKTTRATYDALSMVVGRELTSGQALPVGPLRVGILNGEEDQDELDRRLAATCQRYGISEADLGGRLFAQSVRSLRLVTMVKNVPTVDAEAKAWLLDFVRDNQLDVLIIDPLVSFHRVPENDNGAMDLVIKDVFGSIAEETRAAIELCHHSGKPKEGRTETAVEDSRGASAIIWAVRSARVLNFMTPEEATKLGITEEQRRLHIRIANGKANMAPIGKAVWMKLVVEILPSGDEIACSSSWTPPNPFDGVTTADVELARNWSRTGAYRADPRSPDWFGYNLADHLHLDMRYGDRGPEGATADLAKVKQIIAQWRKNKVLATEERTDDKRRKRIFIVPGSYEPTPPLDADDAI